MQIFRNNKHHERGIQFFKAKKYREAIDEFEYCNYGLDSLDYLAKSYKHLGLYEKAVEAYSKMIRINPNESRFYEDRACVYLDNNQYDLALCDLKKALELTKYLNNNDGCITRLRSAYERYLSALQTIFFQTSSLEIENRLNQIQKEYKTLIPLFYGAVHPSVFFQSTSEEKNSTEDSSKLELIDRKFFPNTVFI